jgi:hypothetical protein
MSIFGDGAIMRRVSGEKRSEVSGVPEGVRKQLMWAFDNLGRLDGDRFLTILRYEKIEISFEEMLELASELTPAARSAYWKFVASRN